MPGKFRPMAELNHTNPVDMLLPGGKVVTGWLFQGVTPRGYWTRDLGRGSTPIEPEGWREPAPVATGDCSARMLAA